MFLTDLCELAELCQGEFDLALALRPWGAGWSLSCCGGAGHSLASDRGNGAGTRYCCGNCLATNDLRHNLLSTLTWKKKMYKDGQFDLQRGEELYASVWLFLKMSCYLFN